VAAAVLAAGAAPSSLRPAPEFVAMFAPRAHRDAYTAFVSPLPIAELLQQLEHDPERLDPPGSWQPRPAGPFDAFGDAGTYNRFRIARLYGATRVLVARGPRGSGAGVSEMWTLISPYPDPDLARLHPGTLVLVLRVR
jgi:hypothetical protein